MSDPHNALFFVDVFERSGGGQPGPARIIAFKDNPFEARKGDTLRWSLPEGKVISTHVVTRTPSIEGGSILIEARSERGVVEMARLTPWPPKFLYRVLS